MLCSDQRECAMTDPHDWERPGVEEVSTGVYRIPLPLPLNVLRAVNIYAITGPDGIALIDAGWSLTEAFDALESGLAELGSGLADVTSVLCTHYHPDHYTLGVELRRRTGCNLVLGEDERPFMETIVEGDEGEADFRTTLIRAGVPADHLAELRPQWTAELYDYPSGWLRDGDLPKAGGRELRAVATPGHTRGHLCFADEDASLLFAGDHVLPHITPALGFAVIDGHEPLADYLDSLRRVRQRPEAMLLPRTARSARACTPAPTSCSPTTRSGCASALTRSRPARAPSMRWRSASRGPGAGGRWASCRRSTSSWRCTRPAPTWPCS